LRSDKDNFSLEINEHFTVQGRSKLIEIKQIRGFTAGRTYGQEVKLLTSPLVKKDGDGYVLLNYGDPRVSSILNKYDSNTKVAVVIIPDEHAEAVKFLAGELSPQVTPTTTFTDFFTVLSLNTTKQVFVRDFFTKQASRSKANLAFNLKRFIEKLGANAPSQSTASKLASSAQPTWKKTKATLEEQKPQNEPNTGTTQEAESFLANHSEDKSLKTSHSSPNNTEPSSEPSIKERSSDTQSEQILAEDSASSYDEYHKSDEFLSSTKTPAANNKENGTHSASSTEAKTFRSMTEEEMRIKWEKHSNSQYPLALLRKILGPVQNKVLTERLNSLQPATPEFEEFLRILLDLVEKRLQKMKVNEPKN
jgi:hypothetical protein